MSLVFRHEKVQELGACKRQHDRRRRKPTVGHTLIPAQMWRSPGADVAQSRCRCGAVPVQMWRSPGGAQDLRQRIGENRRLQAKLAGFPLGSHLVMFDVPAASKQGDAARVVYCIILKSCSSKQKNVIDETGPVRSTVLL
jgi:hypothetical protein